MKAAVLKQLGTALVIENLSPLEMGTGEVIVDVVATRVLPYAREAFSGARNFLFDLPMVPGTGAIGRVRQIGPDATRLKVGDWVICDPTVRSRDDVVCPDILLQGLTAGGDGGLRLQQHFRHGSFAEQIRVPTENASRIGSAEEINANDAPRWCALNTLLVPFGGLLAARLQAGETVLISGATGNFGSAGVAVALAMGAGCVIAPGRNESMLSELSRRFGKRVRTVRLTGNEAEDQQRIRQAAPGTIDCVLDILPPSADISAVRTAAMTVRPYGRIVLMGGVGGQGESGLNLPYPWLMRNCVTMIGQWMYPREAITRMIAMVRAGLVDLEQFDVTTFALERANEAVTHAADLSGAFKMTVITP